MMHKLFIFILVFIPLSVFGVTVKGSESNVKNVREFTLFYDFKNHPSFGVSAYLDDYNRMKGWAWFSLSAGVACGTIGLIGGIENGLYTAFVKWETKWQVLCYIGAASTIASVPLFIIAHKKKRKAISLGAQSVVAPQMNGCISYSPALALNLRF